jgi:hypothetical protein
MASSVIDIANGVAELLSQYNAEVIFTPDFDLKKMQDMRVVVLPVGKERKFATRAAYENVNSVDVAVIHKCREMAAIPDLVLLIEKIGEDLLKKSIGNSLCVKAVWEPLFAVDELKSRGVFIGVIEVSYKELA